MTLFLLVIYTQHKVLIRSCVSFWTLKICRGVIEGHVVASLSVDWDWQVSSSATAVDLTPFFWRTKKDAYGRRKKGAITTRCACSSDPSVDLLQRTFPLRPPPPLSSLDGHPLPPPSLPTACRTLVSPLSVLSWWYACLPTLLTGADRVCGAERHGIH